MAKKRLNSNLRVRTICSSFVSCVPTPTKYYTSSSADVTAYRETLIVDVDFVCVRNTAKGALGDIKKVCLIRMKNQALSLHLGYCYFMVR